MSINLNVYLLNQASKTSVNLGSTQEPASSFAWAMWESHPWWHGQRKAGRLANSVTTQAQIQGLELAYPNIYPVYELLDVF